MPEIQNDQSVEMETLQGQFLVAMPLMDDERFVESVLFVLEHNLEGAMAIAINEPLPKITFADVFKDISRNAKTKENMAKTTVSKKLALRAILKGGPVQTRRGFLLHGAKKRYEGISFAVNNDIQLSASMDTLLAFATDNDPGKSIFTLGYCGWEPGQLEDELAQNVWLTVPYDRELLFDTPFEERYEFALKLLGINRANLSAFCSRA